MTRRALTLWLSIILRPFVHHTMPGTKTMKSYIEKPQFPYKRLPGTTEIKRNDPIVFNFPAGDTVSEVYQSNVTFYQLCRYFGRDKVMNDKKQFGDIITRPVDKRENYVKRLIAMPGDTSRPRYGQSSVRTQRRNRHFIVLFRRCWNGIEREIRHHGRAMG